MSSVAETTPGDSNAAVDTSGFASATAGMTPTESPVSAEEKADVPRISAEDTREKMKAGTVTVIDVRDAMQYDGSHIPGSLSVPLSSIESNLDLLPKGKEIIAYCTCPAEESSIAAAMILNRHGYDKVSALYGGLAAWRNLGYPLDELRPPR